MMTSVYTTRRPLEFNSAPQAGSAVVRKTPPAPRTTLSLSEFLNDAPDHAFRNRSQSNTFGDGRALVPTRSKIRRAERIVSSDPTVFDNTPTSWLDQWSRRVENFATSKGGALLATTSIVLSLGLSPLFLADPADAPIPSTSVSSPAAVAEAPAGR